MQSTDARPASSLLIVGVYTAAFIGICIVLQLLSYFLPVGSSFIALLSIVAAAGVPARMWALREKAVPQNGRAWCHALMCGVVSSIISFIILYFYIQAGDGEIEAMISSTGAFGRVVVSVLVILIHTLFVRLGFWIGFRWRVQKSI